MPGTAEISKNAEITKLHRLQELAGQQVDRAKQLEDIAAAAGRDMTEQEEQEFNACLEQADSYESEYHQRLQEDRISARRTALEDRQDRLNQMPAARTVLNQGVYQSVTHMRRRLLDDPARGYKHVGQFALDVYQAGLPGGAGPSENLLEIMAAATGMQQAQGSLGGFAVPPQFSTQIYDGFATSPDNLMLLCDTYTVTGESLTFPRNPETSRATGSRYGGVRAYWIAEGDQLTGSNPKLGQLKLEPQQLAVLVYATDKLLRNAPALEQYIRRSASEEIMFLVNDAIIRGTGAGQPLGFLNAGALITVNKETGQAVDTVELENVNNMVARLHTRAETGAVWFINKEVEPQLEQLSATVGTGGIPVFIAAPQGFPNVAEPRQTRLKGLPVRTIEWASGLGDLGDVMLANLGFYALGVQGTQGAQGTVDEAMSMHLRFDYAETAFRFMFAVDGQPWHVSPITPYKGNNTLSAFVTLQAR